MSYKTNKPLPPPLWQGMQWSAVKWQLKRFAKGFRFSDTSFRGGGGGNGSGGRKKSRRGESKGRTKQAICHLGSLGAFLFTRFGFLFYFFCWGGVTWFATRMSRGWYVEKVKGSKKGGRGVERQGCSACSIVQNVSVSSLMFGCFCCCCCVQHLSISFRDCHLELSFSISDFLFSFWLKCFAKLTLTACLPEPCVPPSCLFPIEIRARLLPHSITLDASALSHLPAPPSSHLIAGLPGASVIRLVWHFLYSAISFISHKRLYYNLPYTIQREGSILPLLYKERLLYNLLKGSAPHLAGVSRTLKSRKKGERREKEERAPVATRQNSIELKFVTISLFLVKGRKVLFALSSRISPDRAPHLHFVKSVSEKLCKHFKSTTRELSKWVSREWERDSERKNTSAGCGQFQN